MSTSASSRLTCTPGSKGPARAELELDVKGVLKTAKSTGNGPVDATFNAIQAIFPHKAAGAVVGRRGDRRDRRAGEDEVRLEEKGKMVDGQGGSDADVRQRALMSTR